MEKIIDKLEKIASGELPREHAWDVIAMLEVKGEENKEK